MEKKNSTTTQTDVPIHFAGFWIRVLATLIDSFVIIMPLVLLVYLLSAGSWFDIEVFKQSTQLAQLNEAGTALEVMPKADMRWELLFEVLMAGITIIFWKKWAGATPGKKLLKIHVVDAKTYAPITNKQAIVRYISYIASTIPLALGFFMVAFHKEKRALHDILSGTVVTYNK